MDFENSYSPNNFSLITNKHGIVEFSYLSVWRMTLIIENTSKMQNIEPSDFCLIVAKYLISKKENIIYDEEYYKTIKTHNNIKLILENDELDNFSEIFVSIYKTEIIYYTDVICNDNHKIIKLFFLKTKEEFDNLIESTTRFTNLVYDKKLFDKVKKISEVSKIAFPKYSSEELKRITEATKNLSGISSSEISKLSEATKAISGIPLSEISKLSETAQKAIKIFPFEKIAKINENEDILQKEANVENPHLSAAPVFPHHYEIEVLCDIRELFNSFITAYNSVKEYSKGMFEVTNTTINNIRDNLEVQIKSNENTSNRAIHYSIVAIIIAIVVGIVQIIFSQNSNKYIDKMNINIEKLNNNIIELNMDNKNYIDKIETLTNELLLLKENKNIIEDKENQTP